MKTLLRTLIAVVALVLTAGVAMCAQPESVTFCHAAGREDTTQFVTITAAYPAVFGQAGHFNEDGTPRAGHEQDYLGPCVETTPSPTIEPSPEVSESPTITPEPTPSVSPEPSPTMTPLPSEQPSAIPSPIPVLVDTVSPQGTLPPTDTLVAWEGPPGYDREISDEGWLFAFAFVGALAALAVVESVVQRIKR